MHVTPPAIAREAGKLKLTLKINMFGLISSCGMFALFAIGTLRRAAVAFASVLCLYGLKQWGQNTSPFFVNHRTYANWAVAALVAIGLWRSRSQLVQVKILNSTWLLIAALYGYALFTLAWTPNVESALEQWQLQAPYVLTIGILAPLLVSSARDMRLVCEWTAILGGALCALALVFGHWGSRGLLLYGDIYEQETNPLAIAGLGGTVALLAIVSLASPTPWLKKILFAILIPVGLAVVLRSGSRGQLVAVLGALIVGLPLATKKRSLVSWMLAAIVAAAVLALTSWLFTNLQVDSDRWSNAQSSEDAQGRFKMASTLLGAAASNPFSLLAGLGNSSAFQYVGFYPHIAVLEVLAEEGLIGFALYSAILVLAFRSMWQLASRARITSDTQLQFTVAALSSLFIFEWLLTFKQGSLLSSVYVMAYASVAGRLALALESQPTQQRSSEGFAGATPFQNLMS